MYDPLEFWEGHAKDWLKKPQPTSREWQWLKKYVKDDWKIIELGCGSGRWSKHFKHYTGVDISPTLVIAAQDKYPGKQFFHHDQRFPIPKGYDLIFTFTSWLHVSPSDIINVKLPKTRYLFVEPTDESRVEYCFKHNYEKLFGVEKVARHGKLNVYTNY